MVEQNEKKVFNPTTLLIALCWIVYACSYLGKLAYNANITQIETEYSISHSKAGVVSSCFFFAYGIGQIINGLLCRKYNLRVVVFCGLLISGTMNFLVGVVDNFAIIKYLWLINGVGLSVLWSSLIRLLSITLDKKSVGRAVFAMGTTVATGTFLTYGFSAIFVALGVYKMMFFLAGVLLPSISILWFFAYPKLVREKGEIHERAGQVRVESQKRQKNHGLLIAIAVLAFFATVDNLVKDGLTMWVPMILKETYSLPDYVSVLLTMVLPILALFGTCVAALLRKKINDFVVLCGLVFFGAAICIGLVILCMPMGYFAVTLGSFGVVACLMASVNNVITSMAPLYWKDKINSGRVAGILNGFCYLGSMLSAYGLGLVADVGGWNSVFWLLFSLCLMAMSVSICYAIIKGIKRKKRNSIKDKARV